MLAVATVAVAMATAAAPCECPQAYTALLEGKSVVASGTHGHLHVPPCCAPFRNNSWTGLKAAKHTPGVACELFSSCSTCNLMNFCRWKAVTVDTGSCADLNHIDKENMTLYSTSCDSKGEFNPAEVVDLDIGLSDFQKTAKYHDETNTYLQQYQGARTDSEKPHTEYGVGNFAGMFDGYLPPAHCSHSNDVKPTSAACAGFKDTEGQAFIFPQFY